MTWAGANRLPFRIGKKGAAVNPAAPETRQTFRARALRPDRDVGLAMRNPCRRDIVLPARVAAIS